MLEDRNADTEREGTEEGQTAEDVDQPRRFLLSQGRRDCQHERGREQENPVEQPLDLLALVADGPAEANHQRTHRAQQRHSHQGEAGRDKHLEKGCG